MTIPTVSPLPTAPARTDPPATFVTRADAFLAAIVTFQGELNTSIGAMNTDIAGVNADADRAESAADSAVASANFKGAWSSLTGALNIPASVTHNGYIWILLNNLADVTASEPGVSADWQDLPIIPAQTGNAGKFLTTDGSSTSWGTVSAGSTSMTATGAISAGDPVALRTDGTVEKISGYKTARGVISNGVLETSTPTAGYFKIAYDAANTLYCLAYTRGSQAYVRGMRVSTAGVFTLGTETALSGVDFYDPGPSLFYDSTNSNFILFYRNASTAIALRSVSIDSGTLAATLGTEQDKTTGLNANAGARCRLAYDPDANQYFALFKDATSGNAQGAYGTYDGSDITFGTTAVINSDASTNMIAEPVYSTEETRMICSIGSSSTNKSVLVAVLNNSGTPIAGSAAVVQTAAQPFYPAVAWNGTHILQTEQYSNDYFATRATISGSTITVTGSTRFDSDPLTTASNNILVDSGSNKFQIYVCARASLEYLEADMSGSDPTWSVRSDLVTHTTINQISYAYPFFDAGSGGTIICFNDISYASGSQIRIGLFGIGTESTNAQNFFGVADENIANAATGTITTTGGVNTSVSGLTVGKDYFVNANGTLSIEATQYGIAGKALTATSLFVSGTKKVTSDIFTASGDISQGDPVRLNSSGDAEAIVGTHINNFSGYNDQIQSASNTWVATENVPDTNIYVVLYQNNLVAVRIESNGTVTTGSSVSMSSYFDTTIRASTCYHPTRNRIYVQGRANSGNSFWNMLTGWDLDESTLALTHIGHSTFLNTGGSNSYGHGIIKTQGYTTPDDTFFCLYGEGSQAYARSRFIITNSSSITLGSEVSIASYGNMTTKGAVGYSEKHDVVFATYRSNSGNYGFFQCRETTSRQTTTLSNVVQFMNSSWSPICPPVPIVIDDEDTVVVCTLQSTNFIYHVYGFGAAGTSTAPASSDGTAIALGYTVYGNQALNIGWNSKAKQIQGVITENSFSTQYNVAYTVNATAKTLSNVFNLYAEISAGVPEKRRQFEKSNNSKALPFNSNLNAFFTTTNYDVGRSFHTYFYGFAPEFDAATTDGFIGFASEDITDTNQGNVYVSGSYLDSKVKLTAGSSVYLDTLGQPSTTASGTSIGKMVKDDTIYIG